MAVKINTVAIWVVTPRILVCGYQHFGRISIFTLKVKTVCFSGMLISIYQTAWCHYSEDHNMNPGSCTEAQAGENSHRLKQI
jgi:hypothetical protein